MEATTAKNLQQQKQLLQQPLRLQAPGRIAAVKVRQRLAGIDGLHVKRLPSPRPLVQLPRVLVPQLLHAPLALPLRDFHLLRRRLLLRPNFGKSNAGVTRVIRDAQAAHEASGGVVA